MTSTFRIPILEKRQEFHLILQGDERVQYAVRRGECKIPCMSSLCCIFDHGQKRRILNKFPYDKSMILADYMEIHPGIDNQITLMVK